MQYGLIYRLQINDMLEGVITTADIYDTAVLIPDTDTPEIIDLVPMGENPISVSVVNDSKEKFAPVRAKVATLTFKSDNSQFQDFSTFINSTDDNWLCRIYTDNDDTILKGYVMLPDISQPFQPDPNRVELTVSDHLGLLSEIPFTNDSEVNPVGKYRIAEILALCLKKTGLTLDIKVINNLRHGMGVYTYNQGALFGIGDPHTINIFAPPSSQFYVGQQITISGSISNNITTRITEVLVGAGTALTVEATLTSENATGVPITFQDVDSLYHFYDRVWLDAKTFEDEIGTCVSCREVIEKILGEDCFLTQFLGAWYIVRVDEFDNSMYVANFDSDGEYISTDSADGNLRSVGANEAFLFATADQMVQAQRPHKSVSVNYPFEYPLEIIDNIDFDRGQIISDTATLKTYTPDSWAYTTAPYTPDSLPIANNVAYIQKTYVDGYETERKLVIPANGESNALFSNPVYIHLGDKFDLSVDFAWSSNQGGGMIENYPVFFALLRGTDGSNYYLDSPDLDVSTGSWVATSSLWSPISPIDTRWDRSAVDETEYQTVLVNAPPAPVSGELFIALVSVGGNGGFPSVDVYFNNLTFTYKPLINGSYQKYDSQKSKVIRDPVTGYNSVRDKDVAISDSPKQLFKGAMYVIGSETEIFSGSVQFFADNAFTISGDKRNVLFLNQVIRIDGSTGNDITARIESVTYFIIGNKTEFTINRNIIVDETATVDIYRQNFVLTYKFFASAPFGLTGPPSSDYCHPYAYIQAFSIWNQYRLAARIIDGTVLRLNTVWPDLTHRITLTDAHDSTNNRIFMVISLEQNWRNSLWSATFIEVNKTDDPKIYSDTFEFKYISGS